uniref:Ribonuclease H-like domain-containing protein n=1 Tax=Tanacetum cinerariifolium TaxID=118510 RepID=A0A699GL96_TANCI|nr:ribonuclease H-like domain-containing protein [Tanacetum cinerariifolium]
MLNVGIKGLHGVTAAQLVLLVLQKIISQPAVLGVFISQEDLNLKFLRSLPFEWNTHVVVWRNKSDLDLMSIDDIYTNFKIVKQEQYDDLRVEFNKSEFNLVTYKRGLASVEEQLVFYKKNKVLFCDQITVLKRDLSHRDSEINELKIKLEKLKKEKESTQLKLENFDQASKSLDKLIGSQITNNSKKGLGYESYHAVQPPPTGLFLPPKIDLSYSGLEEFQQPEFQSNGPKSCETEPKVSDNKDCSVESSVVVEKKTIIPTDAKMEFVKAKQQEKPVRKPVKYAEMYRSQGPRGNQRNWNNLKSQQLGSNFSMYNKASFVCRSFEHVQANCNYHQRERMVSRNNYSMVNHNNSTRKTYPNAHRNNAPRAVLMKTGLRPLNTARPVNTAHPKTIVNCARPMLHFYKSAQSTVKWPYQQRTSFTNKSFRQTVNTARPRPVNTARPRPINTVRLRSVNTARLNSAIVNAIRGHPEQVQEDQGYTDSGCSRHMTGNMSYLSDFKEFNRGYVSFRGGANGGKINGKGTIYTGNIDFEDVYFVKELKFNLFSVSQMRNGTLIEANKTMLADSKLPTTFWAKEINTACYVQNMALVVKPHNKTPYELFRDRTPALSFMKPFGCHVTILNTLDHIGKFDGKEDEGYFVGYSMNSKAFRVYNTRTRRVEENLHIEFLENKPIVVGARPRWLFDINMLTESMNYVPVIAGTNSNDFVGGASKQGRIAEINVNKDLSLINETTQDQERMNDEDLFRVDDLDSDEVIADVIVGENVEQDATVVESVKEEEQRIAKQKEEEANIVIIVKWDNTQAMMDADYELAIKL